MTGSRELLPKVGVHGFGRIGRALFRANAASPLVDFVAVNDVHEDVDNLRYLLEHDSVYGRFELDVGAADRGWFVDGRLVRTSSHSGIENVPWRAAGAEIVVDATTERTDRAAYEQVLATGVGAVFASFSRLDADITIVRGVNGHEYDPGRHRVVSTSTCDGCALAPVLLELDRAFSVESGFVTTLHPWLSYQNLLDAPLARGSIAPEYWSEYGLGRAATTNVIPKETTVLRAVEAVLPDLALRFESVSFRVPLPIICAAHVVARVRARTTAAEVNELFDSLDEQGSPIRFETTARVSSDFVGERACAVVDGRWSKVVDGRTVGITLWYDNEFGYAANMLALVGAAATAARAPVAKQLRGVVA